MIYCVGFTLCLDESSVMNSVMDSVTTDDGIGFDPEKKSDGFGIRSMQERANALGGAVTFESAPGKGTRISVTVALEILEQDEIEAWECDSVRRNSVISPKIRCFHSKLQDQANFLSWAVPLSSIGQNPSVVSCGLRRTPLS